MDDDESHSCPESARSQEPLDAGSVLRSASQVGETGAIVALIGAGAGVNQADHGTHRARAIHRRGGTLRPRQRPPTRPTQASAKL